MAIIQVFMRTAILTVCQWVLEWQVLVLRGLAVVALRLEDVVARVGVGRAVDVQAEVWEAHAVGQEAAVGEEVAVDAEVVVVRRRNYCTNITKEWDGKRGGVNGMIPMFLYSPFRVGFRRARDFFLNEMRPRINSESISHKCSV